MALHAHKTGLALGGMLGLVHLFWALLVALGIAQAFMNMMFQLHMITPVYVVMPFSFMLALGLVIMTCVVGYIVGYVFAAVWNQVQK